MAITGATPAMQNAIRSNLQLDKLETGQKQNLYLRLSYDKDYVVKINDQGKVSVNRDLEHLSTAGRIKNAVVDFFNRATTKGESAFTTRANQIQSEVQAQVDFLPVKELVQKALNTPIIEFKNEGQYLKPGVDISTASFDDVTDSNKARLGLNHFNEQEQAIIMQSFPSFISGKDAIFSNLSDKNIQALSDLMKSETAGDQRAVDAAMAQLAKTQESFNEKVNVEFNSQFMAKLEATQSSGLESLTAQELESLTKDNTSANGDTKLSSIEKAQLAVTDGEAKVIKERENADKPKKGVRFNDDPVSDIKTFIKGSRIKV